MVLRGAREYALVLVVVVAWCIAVPKETVAEQRVLTPWMPSTLARLAHVTNLRPAALLEAQADASSAVDLSWTPIKLHHTHHEHHGSQSQSQSQGKPQLFKVAPTSQHQYAGPTSESSALLRLGEAPAVKHGEQSGSSHSGQSAVEAPEPDRGLPQGMPININAGKQKKPKYPLIKPKSKKKKKKGKLKHSKSPGPSDHAKGHDHPLPPLPFLPRIKADPWDALPAKSSRGYPLSRPTAAVRGKIPVPPRHDPRTDVPNVEAVQRHAEEELAFQPRNKFEAMAHLPPQVRVSNARIAAEGQPLSTVRSELKTPANEDPIDEKFLAAIKPPDFTMTKNSIDNVMEDLKERKLGPRLDAE